MARPLPSSAPETVPPGAPVGEDPSLVRLRPAARAGRWLLACAAVTLALFAAFLLPARTWRKIPVGRGLTQDDAVRQQVNHYIFGRRAHVVLLGSSLMERLHEPFFTLPGVRNLALQGGTPLTGLQIVAAGPVPEVVVIETNVLDRAPSPALVRSYQAPPVLGREFLLLRHLKPLRTALAATLERRSEPSVSALRASPPREYSAETVERVRASWQAREVEGATRPRAAEIVRLAGELEQRGARVFFVTLPLDPRLVPTCYPQSQLRLLREASAGHEDRWLPLTVDPAQLRWEDGAHLDLRSAALVAEALQAALQARLAAPRAP